ncbi:hypothetical protein LV457_14080 [Mycobacterium sp. MYCO198283]|uniref:hypothetical protein n=1 Tax=Mycobacterium sp. MYCO198283 TaxID=2883505 RepID=UPI001E431FAF|nr:hypothetical protein [Mycobacterium sp. MYCO198283]MCG5433407.1 hypothetical protein [Mycobacterium sp. MYCO198283]
MGEDNVELDGAALERIAGRVSTAAPAIRESLAAAIESDWTAARAAAADVTEQCRLRLGRVADGLAGWAAAAQATVGDFTRAEDTNADRFDRL